jgi:two-component system cell cycle response regulator
VLVADRENGATGSGHAALPLVLVADDDGVTRAMLGSWLTGSGYGVVEARDGEEALRLAGEREPDLMLVDLIMPGIGGYEVCRAIQDDSRAAPPVIVITAHDQEEGRMIGLDAGAADYMVKPFNQDALIEHVRAALPAKAVHDGVAVRAGHDALTDLLTRSIGEAVVDPDPLPLVLIADDDGVTRAMVGSWLTGSGYGVVEARDGDEALRLAGEHAPDLLVIDLIMPGLDGYDVCRAIQAGETPRPVIFITAHDRTGGRVVGLDAGAVDFIIKPFAQEELVARVRAALRTKVERDELADQAAHDPLTGLLNRRELDARADETVALAQRHGRPLSCLLLDLDHFKEVNDVHGHAAGDQVLRETGRRLATACRISDVVARYGGEEFVLLLPETPLEAAAILADKLRSALSGTPFGAGDPPITMRASIGAATLTAAMETPASLLAAADKALYRAKELGRDRTELYEADALAAPA